MVFESIFKVLRRAKTEPDSIFVILGWMVWQLASCPERVELAALAPLATGALLGTSSAHLGTAIPNIMKNFREKLLLGIVHGSNESQKPSKLGLLALG